MSVEDYKKESIINKTTDEINVKTDNEKIEVNLSILMKFIQPFNGDRDRLTPFLLNCERALALAHEKQKNILLSFILSQLEDKAQSACSNKIITTFDQLKKYLKQNFGDTKTQAHLLIELQNCRQGLNENIASYMLRLETCQKKLKTSITHSNTKMEELSGRYASADDLALQTFIIGVNSRISDHLRARVPQSLNDAFQIALEEEKLFKLLQSTNRLSMNAKNCGNCGKVGHLYHQCYRNKDNNKNKYKKVHTFQAKFNKMCDYCKRSNHVIDDCFIKDPSKKKKFFENRNKTFKNNRNHNKTSAQINVVDEDFLEKNASLCIATIE